MSSHASMTHLLFVATIFAAAAAASAAYDPGSQNFTHFYTQAQLGGNHPYLDDATLMGPTVVTAQDEQTNPLYTTDGSLHAEGSADFGTLKAMVHVQGPAALYAHTYAAFNDHWTISDPALTGTTGTMQLAFDVHGLASALDGDGIPISPGSGASVGLIVNKNPSTSSNGDTLLNAYQVVPSPAVIDTPASPASPFVTAPFEFTYGQPFGIRVTLAVNATTDNHYISTSLSPYYEYYGGGDIDQLTVDFSNTAALSAIVIDGLTASTTIGADSTADFSPQLTDQLPVPEPGALMLLVGAMPLVIGRRRWPGGVVRVPRTTPGDVDPAKHPVKPGEGRRSDGSSQIAPVQ